MSSDSPFWFAKEDLLTDLLQVEIHSVRELFAKYPDLREFFDLPEATMQQRAACFAVLAHRAIMDKIYETFAVRYEQSPSLGEEENDAIKLSQNLFAEDAPAWVSETQQVVWKLPAHLNDSLPEPLRIGGYRHDNPEQNGLIESAVEHFSNVEQIHALIEGVLAQQLQRLEGRWSVARPVETIVREIVVREQKPNKPKNLRTSDKQRIARDKRIFEIDDAAPTIYEYIKLMDEREVPPLSTWRGWPGSWSKAYNDPRFRKLIQQDKSRALVRVRRARK